MSWSFWLEGEAEAIGASLERNSRGSHTCRIPELREHAQVTFFRPRYNLSE